MLAFMWRTVLAVIFAGLGLAGFSASSHAVDASGVALSRPWGERSYSVTLEQLAPASSIELRGVDDTRGIYFGLRSDEQVKRLRLELAYQYSSKLIESLSHLNVILNGEVVDTIMLAEQPQGGSTVLQHISELPLGFLQRHNQLEIQLVSHYTLACENPVHPDLWADIDRGSRLLFDVDPVVLPNELGLLPAPFFDTADVRRLKLPFVVAGASDAKLQAAGVVASWLGALSGFRGVDFSARMSALPDSGHAVVVLSGADSLPGLSLPAIQGPTVAMVPNPRDSSGKLLLITGRNDAEIKTAAAGLALGAEALSGPVATFGKVDYQPRKPYDAPNWLPTDRPVQLGELLPANRFTVAGRDPWPITLRLRVPPDLSRWRVDYVPLDLKYRYVSYGLPEDSSLSMQINGSEVWRTDLITKPDTVFNRIIDKKDGIMHEQVRIPAYSFASDASLEFKFRYPTTAEQDCTGALVDTRRSAIDPESTIDLTGMLHHMAMPNLGAFRGAGFPFTRMADLSETVVVLPPAAGDTSLAAYLNVMGRIGESTAYPALGLTVSRRPEANMLEDKDVLIFSVNGSTPLLKEWAAHLPVATGVSQPERSTAAFWSIGGFLDRLSSFLQIESGASGTLLSPSTTLMAGFESPVSKGRSVVVLSGASDASLMQAIDFMAGNQEQGLNIQGGAVVLTGGRMESVSDEKAYYVGELGPFRSMQFFFSERPIVLVFFYMLGALLMGVLFFLSLRARARQRLRSDESE